VAPSASNSNSRISPSAPESNFGQRGGYKRETNNKEGKTSSYSHGKNWEGRRDYAPMSIGRPMGEGKEEGKTGTKRKKDREDLLQKILSKPKCQGTMEPEPGSPR